MLRRLLLLFAALAPSAWLSAQAISLELRPAFVLPILGSESTYSPGWGATVGVDYQLPFAPLFVATGGLDFAMTSVEKTAQALSILGAGGGGGLSFSPLRHLHLRLVGTGGYYLGLYRGQSGGSPYYGVSGGISYSLSSGLALGAGASFVDYMGTPVSLLRGVKAWMGLTWSPVPEKVAPRLELPTLELSPVFPVFYKFFDGNSLGRVVIRNGESVPVTKVRVSFYAKEFMDTPKLCAELAALKPGESADLKLYALFKESILGITEGTKISATVRVDYQRGEEALAAEKSMTLRVYDRNAMTWEDDRRAASFVAAKDPMVMKFAKAVNAAARDDPSPAANLNFRIALGMFQGMGSYGLRYTVNPKGSYAEKSVNKFAVDYLQFPRQTLDYRGGDCSDLSILYSALLESLGIETAFITIPGHIFLAFAPGIDPAAARVHFSNSDDLIIVDGKLWVPVEITMVKDGFLRAWAEGAREWRGNTDSRRFYPMHESWQVYEPVGMLGEEGSLPNIATPAFVASFQSELGAFASREVASRETAIQSAIVKSGSSPSSLNSLGILFARFGILDKAKAQFELAAKIGRAHV